ncbi:pantoate--beta-alanine ligase [bacterium]|nr:pantoate--beta-alanine ligase [bacterium]
MEVIESVQKMCELGAAWRRDDEITVALVPTMGALHAGHARLIEKAKSLADITIVSSFVNPLQFTEEKDLADYPRTPKEDKKLCKDLGVEYFFAPSGEDMFPPGFLTTANVSYLSTKLEGESRQGHFRGVCTVVLKLIHITQPDYAIFGHKDAQQLVILKHMVRDLCIDVNIEAIPTVRDKDGLALSSRNVLLSDEQRKQALCLHRALKRVHFLVSKQGILHRGELLQAVRSHINSAGDQIELDYANIVSRTTLEEIDLIESGNTLVLVAARVGGVRLIDNTRL